MFSGLKAVKYPRTVVGVLIGAPAAAGTAAIAAGAGTVGVILLAADAALVLLLAALRVIEVVLERRSELDGYLGHPLCPVEELTPYGLGADPEAPSALQKTGQSEHARYLGRDVDGGLREVLLAAADSSTTEMIVVFGPSKAGKTRTLFEAVHASLPNATAVVPRDAEAIDALAGESIPRAGESDLVVWWLEDLEDYVEVGKGMSPKVLRDLAARDENTLVVATAGGKGGARRGSDVLERLAEPLADLLHQAQIFELHSELSEEERTRAEDYAPAAAGAISRDGIGEFMITAPELEMKLGSGKHRFVDEETP
ncbi:MAG TPA: hypothetical protein VFZ19_07615, partial [Solirubrobacterales bacterium]